MGGFDGACGRVISAVSCRRERDAAFGGSHTVAVFRVEGLGFVAVSHRSSLPAVGPECMAFRCDERGEVADWDELAANRIADPRAAIAACLEDALGAVGARTEGNVEWES